MFEVVLFAAFFIFYCHLASEWEQRHTAPTAPVVDDLPQPELLEEASAQVELSPAAAAPMAAPVAIAVEPVEPVAVDLAAMTSQQLRKKCSKAGIQWRNVHGKGKHLKKGEMLKALAG
jgi:zona occludens toxin (predicted ATPase)